MAGEIKFYCDQFKILKQLCNKKTGIEL